MSLCPQECSYSEMSVCPYVPRTVTVRGHTDISMYEQLPGDIGDIRTSLYEQLPGDIQTSHCTNSFQREIGDIRTSQCTNSFQGTYRHLSV